MHCKTTLDVAYLICGGSDRPFAFHVIRGIKKYSWIC